MIGSLSLNLIVSVIVLIVWAIALICAINKGSKEPKRTRRIYKEGILVKTETVNKGRDDKQYKNSLIELDRLCVQSERFERKTLQKKNKTKYKTW